MVATGLRCDGIFNNQLERCNQWPHVANCHISGRYRQQLNQLLSLRRRSHYDVIRYRAGHSQLYGCTYGHLTAFNI